MEFTSYQMVQNNTASLNTGSYLNRTEYTMFVDGYINDLWYGYSSRDGVEIGLWDRNQNFIGWDILNQSKSYDSITLSYINTLNFPVTYSYTELLSDFILYRNEKILINPTNELSTSFNIETGSYYLTYNFIRDMAGSKTMPLVIKDISPSRRELKLIPLSVSDVSYEAFCKKKVLISDVSSLYLKTIKNCSYNEIYAKTSPLYLTEINTIKNLFHLNTDGQMLSFFQNLYEDVLIYTSTTEINSINTNGNSQLVRIQGIQTYFSNYLLSNLSSIVDFSDIDQNFRTFVSTSIERKFSPIGPHPSQEYVNAKSYCYDFFTKFYYQPLSDNLASIYREKYYSILKNGLNFGSNQILPILNHGYMDERININDPLTLLIKLKEELPNDFSIQSYCWVSNISLTPYVVSSIFKSPRENVVHKIGPPNFSTIIPNASLTNTNLSYNEEDLTDEDSIERELSVSRKLNELNVDYSNFENFVVFSSAEMRLKIFKNKIINISSYNTSLQNLDEKNQEFLSNSGSSYPFYTEEYNTIQSNITDIINSFDGYESYLYRSGNYNYSNGNFVSSSYITYQDTLAREYDQTNFDSLINNCPKHVVDDPEGDDYIIFLSMIGHFFDELYVYISNMPSEKEMNHSSTEDFTRRIVDYMLETFGWNLGDSFEQINLIDNYLTNEQLESLNSMSAEDVLKEVRNRVLINLPQIYKSKGTEVAVKMLLSCYGIPSTLLSIREYGGVNYSDDTSIYTNYERAYMYQFDTSSKYNYFQTGLASGAKTFTFKISIDGSEYYEYDQEHILFGSVLSNDTSSISGSGEWAVGFVRKPAPNSGQFFFRIGYKGQEQFQIYTPNVPLFDGNIYSVMLRKNLPSDYFDYTSNTNVVPCVYDLYVQRNEFGKRILRLTSSAVNYDADINYKFNGTSSNLIVGGWFTEYNGQGYTGTFDKLNVWYDPLSDNNFEDYVNSINSYSYSGSRSTHESLMFRMHTDYPMNLQSGSWSNANAFYSTASEAKQIKYLGVDASANMDKFVCHNGWNGSQKIISTSCNDISSSTYPFQFKVIDYPSSHPVSKYGPNKFYNEKIKHLSQSISARFDDKERSTYIHRNNISPDSTQVGFFVDPQDFKNKDIVRYFGNFDFMEVIGDPSNQYTSSYNELINLRNLYSNSKNDYSGSKTLFNELITVYKLYFNRSIFDSIKNLTPARANTLVGILIEPTILERPKYTSKPIFSETNSGSVFYYEATASHYYRESDTKLMHQSMSLEWCEFGTFVTGSGETITGFNSNTIPSNRYIDIDLSYLNLPSITYPVNYGGNCIGDLSDKYQLGHLAGDILST